MLSDQVKTPISFYKFKEKYLLFLSSVATPYLLEHFNHRFEGEIACLGLSHQASCMYATTTF